MQDVCTAMPTYLTYRVAPLPRLDVVSAASFGGASAAPTKVERRGGVMYDPDQYDSENASRFGRR